MRDPRTFQQEHGVTLFLPVDRHQNVDDPDFALAAGLDVEHSALQNALETKLWHRWDLNARCAPQGVGLDVLLEVGRELTRVCPASLQYLAYRRGIEDRE